MCTHTHTHTNTTAFLGFIDKELIAYLFPFPTSISPSVKIIDIVVFTIAITADVELKL